MANLASRQCVPCRGGVPPMRGEEIREFVSELQDWDVVEEHHLKKDFKFKDFREALAFVGRSRGTSPGHLFRLGLCAS